MTQKYISRLTVLGLPFVRRPACEPPKEGGYVIADNGIEGGWTDRQPAKYQNGEWLPFSGKKMRFAPMYWSEIDGARHDEK